MPRGPGKPKRVTLRYEFTHTLMRVVGIVAVATGVLIGGKIAWFYYHQNAVAARMVKVEANRIAQATHPKATTGGPYGTSNCSTGTSTPPGGPQGLLVVPALRMQAPVVQGDGNTSLDVAVGHIATSVWPGQVGTSVLAAHNVSWFSQIDHLHTGDTVRYETACGTSVYRVTGHEIVAAGSPLNSTTYPTLALETCYPLDALWWTSQRYLVMAKLISQGGNPRALTPPSPPAPLALGLPRSQLGPAVSVPLGKLSVLGDASPSWRQSLAPIVVESAFISLYEHAMAAAASGNGPVLMALSNGHVPLTSAQTVLGATITHYSQALSPTISVQGGHPVSVFATSTVSLDGGATPGRYAVQAQARVVDNELILTSLTFAPLP